jgi:cysteinyl-tRNA synthetase
MSPKRRLLFGAQVRRLRQAFRQVAGRPACRRARRCHGRQAGSARLRAVEACARGRARRSEVGIALGPGRPGWHIECSAMGSQLLGRHFDIHGGGQDLQFPAPRKRDRPVGRRAHCQFVNYWMHNGFVRVDDEKMSKSLGNFFTIREVLKKYDAEVVRFFILRAHYRSPLNYSDVHLDDARQALTRLYTALKGVAGGTGGLDGGPRGALQGRAGRRFRHAGGDGGAVRSGHRGESRRRRPGASAQGAGRRAGPFAARPAEFLQAARPGASATRTSN